MEKISKRTGQPWSLGLLIMFLGLLLLVSYLLFFPRPSGIQTITNDPDAKLQEKVKPTGIQNLQWENYVNEELGFKMSIPRLLYKREFSDQGGYKTFIRFEQTNFSLEKGIAVGVSEKTFEEEVESIKEALSGEGAVLKNEEKIIVSDIEGVKLTFVAKEGQEGEPRSIVIFSKEGLTYSISTTPEQIDRVIEGFNFL